MCGIAGIFDTRGRRPVSEALLGGMNDAQFHRGPDDSGMHIEPGTGLAHRRLAVIDLAGGRQPLFNEDGSVAVIYNGEIYNFKELARELAQAGHRFRTYCDTEVIVHAWEAWGERCVERFRGMFAFAVWDRHRETLFLARDRLGIKPLHYAWLADGHLIFGSELKALMADPRLSHRYDEQAIEDYFALGYIPDPRTIFGSVSKLPPGHTLIIQRGRAHSAPRRYWDVSFEDNGVRTQADAVEEIDARLTDAVQSRLVADVPLGAFLSGGVDSSAVVAAMAGLVDGPVNTCSISFGDPAFNEVAYAEQVARRYGTSHRVERVDADALDGIDRLVGLYDEPYADSSALPTDRVCRLARERVTVALSGDGGDESFAGYRRYRWHMREERIRRVIPRPLRRSLFGAAGRVYPKIDWAPKIFRAKSTLQALARDSVEAYFHNFAIIPDALRFAMYSEDFRRRLGGYHAMEVFKGHLSNAPEHPLSAVQYLDFKTYLPGDILTKVDRASMAHSLEVRVPVLDHRLVEWVSGLRADWQLQGGEGKYLLKKALEPRLPRELLYRRKMGFAVPLASWFRGPLRQRVRDSLLGSDLADAGLFDRKVLRRIVDQHQSGARDYSAAIWSLLMFEGFQRRLTQGGTQGSPAASGVATASRY